MLLACKAVHNTVQSRKNSNRSNQSNKHLNSVLTELNAYINKASAKISYGLKTSDKDDLAQEARLRVSQTFQRKAEKGLSYFKRTAVNAMLDVYSREKSNKSEILGLDETNNTISDSTDATVVADAISLRVSIQKWINQLPLRLQQVYQLLYVEDYTQREAAVKLGISQPRIAFLHDQLKERGLKELRHLDY
jgi:RNA polymerase sigma factor (sigma-70 family)